MLFMLLTKVGSYLPTFTTSHRDSQLGLAPPYMLLTLARAFLDNLNVHLNVVLLDYGGRRQTRATHVTPIYRSPIYRFWLENS